MKYPRTATAAVLTMAAVTIPAAAWYLVGSRSAAREAEHLLTEPLSRMREDSTRMAERLAIRLDELRRSEEMRPFHHYQSLYHDPKGAHEGVSVIPSPLAGGPTDPLIRAHFQIDSYGHLTLPTLNEEVCDLNLPESEASQQPILRELQVPARTWWTDLLASPTESAGGGPDPGDGRVIILDRRQWVQNVRASQLYLDIKSGRERKPLEDSPHEDVIIHVGEFEWQSVNTEGHQMLVALRRVVTPEGPLLQGFEVSHQELTRLLESLPFEAQLGPGPPSSKHQVEVPLQGKPWHVGFDMASYPALAQARRDAERVWSGFLGGFIPGILLALLAGGLVVAMVYHSESLAHERSEFAAAAAHELRTPLTGLRMYGEMLADGLGRPERARDYARRIADEAERLGRLVSNIMGFTRLERGSLQVALAPTPSGEMMRSCLERIKPTVEGSGASLRWRFAEGLPVVDLDADACRQIVENLVDNAEKHSRSAADRTIDVEVEAADGKLSLSVSDRGPGLSPDSRRRLFQPFARNGGPDAPPGLGLGLAMVRTLAEAQGGHVEYRDREGGGAVFTVTFPTPGAGRVGDSI